MRRSQPAKSALTSLVGASRSKLWKRRFTQTGSDWWWLLAAAVAGLAAVHRSLVALPVAWTLAAAALAIAATLTLRIAASRPALNESLREADRAAGTDMLIASAWSLRQLGAAHADWAQLHVRRSAERAAAKGLAAQHYGGEALRLPRYSGALVMLAAALLALAQPGGERALSARPETASPPAPTTAPDARSASRAPADDARLPRNDQASIPREEPAPQLADTEAGGDSPPQAGDAGDEADTGGPRGDQASAQSAPSPTAGADMANTPETLVFVDIRRRGARTSAATAGPDARGGAGITSDTDATQAGKQALPGTAAPVAPPPVDANPVLRHYLSRWQQRQETQR